MIWGSIAWIPLSYRAVLYVRYNDIKKWKEINLMSSKRYEQGNNELHTCCLIHGNKWIISFYIWYRLLLFPVTTDDADGFCCFLIVICIHAYIYVGSRRMEEVVFDFRLTLIWMMEFLIFLQILLGFISFKTTNCNLMLKFEIFKAIIL